MKTVVSGVALAAILALAVPAWAQGTDAQQSNAPATGVQQSNAPATGVSMSQPAKAHTTRGMHARKASHRNVHHAAMNHRAGRHYAATTRSTHRMAARSGGMSPTDNMANQLNRAENQRLSGGSTPPMSGQNMAPSMGAPNMGNANAGNPNMAPMGAPNQPGTTQGR